jgi:hypothetical protein
MHPREESFGDESVTQSVKHETFSTSNAAVRPEYIWAKSGCDEQICATHLTYRHGSWLDRQNRDSVGEFSSTACHCGPQNFAQRFPVIHEEHQEVRYAMSRAQEVKKPVQDEVKSKGSDHEPPLDQKVTAATECVKVLRHIQHLMCHGQVQCPRLRYILHYMHLYIYTHIYTYIHIYI